MKVINGRNIFKDSSLLMVFLVSILFFCSVFNTGYLCIKLYSRSNLLLSDKEKGKFGIKNTLELMKESKADETTIPIINVHMEEPERDPLEVKRFEDERHLEKMRIRDLEEQEIQDARIFQQILANQNTNLGTLTQLEHSSANLLKKVSSEYQ